MSVRVRPSTSVLQLAIEAGQIFGLDANSVVLILFLPVATKWNGHEAFVLLRDGYVFNGPQTATILLAELSKIRLQRD